MQNLVFGVVFLITKKIVMGNATDTAIFIHIYTELNIRTM